jgi:hypothetical protein
MGREEIGVRLGAHRVESRVTFEWTRPRFQPAPPRDPDTGADTAPDRVDPVKESETVALAQSASGDFQLRMENDHNEGFELVRSEGGIFVRGLFGPFRRRRSDRTDPARLREQALSSLETLDRLARGLKLGPPVEGSQGGRPVVTYEIEGGEARPNEPPAKEPVPVQYPEAPGAAAGKPTGPDLDTARRLAFAAYVQPKGLSGRVSFDLATGAPLSAEVAGHFQVPPQRPDEPPADLEIQVQLATREVGGAVRIERPLSEPPPATPHAVKDPLRFLGRLPVDEDDEEGAAAE